MMARRKTYGAYEEARRNKNRRASSFVGNIQQNVLAQFGASVRARRKTLNMTQEDLAKLTGLNRSYLSELERGKVNISLERAKGLADALSCRLRDLLDD